MSSGSGYRTPRYKRRRYEFPVTPIPLSARLAEAAPGTATMARRGRRSRRTNAQMGCYTAEYNKSGYKLSRNQFRNVLVDASKSAYVLRMSGIQKAFQRLTIGSDTKDLTQSLLNYNGFYKMTCAATDTTTPLSLPIWAFDVTSTPNMYNQVLTYPRTAWTLSAANSTKGAAMTWSNPSGAYGDTRVQFQFESDSVNPGPGDKSLLDWFEAKFLFYAPFRIPVRVNIDLVQFKLDSVMPGGHKGDGSYTMNDSNDVAFWETMMKKYVYSPLESGNPRLESKYIRYLERKSFILDCKTTVENESTHYKQFTYFKRMNKVCKYKWLDPGTMVLRAPTIDGGVGNEDWIQNAQSPNYWTVNPNQRTFLLVRAFAGQVSGSTTFDYNFHPSFDLILRTKHSTLTN